MMRLGWIKNYFDEDTGRLKTDFAVSESILDKATIAEFDKIIGYIAQIRPFLLDYLILRENFSDITNFHKNALNIIFDEGIKSGGGMTIKIHTLAQQKFINFLISSSTMISHYNKRISRIFTRKSKEFGYISSIEDELSKKFVSFDICRYLRNYAAHHALPIDNIPSKFSWNNEVGWEGEHTYTIKKENLLANRQVRKGLSAHLTNFPDVIHLPELMDEYFRILSSIFTEVIGFFNTQISTVIHYREAVMKYKPDIEGVRPVLWKGGMPKMDEEYKANISEFSFDEVYFLVQILSEIKSYKPV